MNNQRNKQRRNQKNSKTKRPAEKLDNKLDYLNGVCNQYPLSRSVKKATNQLYQYHVHIGSETSNFSLGVTLFLTERTN